MRLKDARIGYYSEVRVGEDGDRKVVLLPHNPKVQAVFESVLREGTRRRRNRHQKKKVA